jgi:hypothetical protein
VAHEYATMAYTSYQAAFESKDFWRAFYFVVKPKDFIKLKEAFKGQSSALQLIDELLEKLKGKLPKQNFYRINRQCIVNAEAIQEIQPEGTQLLLALSVPLYVSQRNVAAFKK